MLAADKHGVKTAKDNNKEALQAVLRKYRVQMVNIQEKKMTL